MIWHYVNELDHVSIISFLNSIKYFLFFSVFGHFFLYAAIP